MEPVIRVEQLKKAIKGKLVLKNITFDVFAGECLALIGQNGAGKTSLLACLIGDWLADSGTISINGLSPRSKALRGRVAVLSQENTIPGHLKVIELITFFRSIAENPLSQEAIKRYLAFEEESYHQLASKLSGGQKRLLAFILCLIGKPDILVLDEPTAGMDTSTRQRFWKIIDQLKAQGMTILYSSHYIEEVEHTADRILVLQKGSLVRDTTPFDMRHQDKVHQITLPLDYLDVIKDRHDIYDLRLKKDCFDCKTKQLASLWRDLEEVIPITVIDIQHKTLLDTLFEVGKEAEDESIA